MVVVSAPSGAGKSTILARALEALPDVRFSVSHTTRPPRAGEQDGVEYHFVQRPAFEELLRSERFLEHAEVHGHLYGTCWSEHEEAQRAGVDLVLDLDVQGAAQLRQRLPDALTVFLLPPSFDELSGRLRARGQDDEATVRRRLKGAREELSRFGEYDYAIVNEDLERSVEALTSVIRSARCRTSRLVRTAQEILETFQVE